MKNIILSIMSICLFLSCESEIGDNSLSNDNLEQRIYESLKVYETARDTDLRLSENGTIQFKNKTQALESQKSIFINPKRLFQEFRIFFLKKAK